MAKANFVRSGVLFLALCLLPLCLLLTGGTSASAEVIRGNRGVFSGAFSLSETYDDNILEYSPADLDLLAGNLKPAKFGIRTPGDFRTSVDARFDLAPVLLESNPTRLRLRLGADLFARNSIENYQAYGLELKQNFLLHNYVQVTSRYIPRFYLRNLLFSDSTLNRHEYVEAIFSRQSYSFELGRAFSRYSSASVTYRYDKTDYNSEFDERDNNANSVSADLSLGTGKGGIDLTYTHREVSAKGRDMAPAKEDISNRSDRIGAGLDLGLWRNHASSLSLRPSFVFENQTYTTSKLLDRYHNGRKDTFYRISSELSYRWSKDFEQFLRYSYERNKTNRQGTLDVGDYTANKILLGFSRAF